MPTYRIRLDSQTDHNWQETVLQAPTAQHARQLAEQRAQAAADFTLFAPKPQLQEGDAHVRVADLNARDYAPHLPATVIHDDREEAASEALKSLFEYHELDSTGKAHGPTARGRAHLAMHMQTVPYKVSSIDPIDPAASLLVAQLKSIYEADAGDWDQILAALRAQGVPTNAVTAVIFGLQAQKQIDGSGVIVWSTATIKNLLTTSAWTPNQDTQDFANDVTNEVTGTGYTAGGVTIGSKTSTYDTASDQIRLDGGDASWPGSTLTGVRRSVVLNDTAGASSTDPVMGYVDFGADVATTAGTLTEEFDPTGIFVYDVT